MTEFDFDELDRAVNNLMSDVDTSKRNEAFDDPAEKTVELSTPDDQSAPAPVAAPPAPQALSAKRRGRFMDVVHPSSDMGAVASPKREGVMVQPVVPVPQVSEISTPPAIPAEEAPESESAVTEAPAALSVEESPTPDATNDTTPTNDQASEELPSTEPADRPMESPFLSDAVVEKRPLGAPTEGEQYAPEPVESSSPDPSQPVDSAPEAEPTPQELAPDIMNVESGAEVQPEAEPVAPAPEAPIVAIENSAPADIVPQYTEAETHASEPSGAIYDTAAYHQALEHPAKKRSGWGVVLWILLLLIVGAVAGAAYFYFTTQY